MKTEILNIVGEWLKPIRAQMEQNNKAMLQNMANFSTSPASRQDILSAIQSRLPKVEQIDMGKIRKDAQLTSIFSRIKYSRLSREQRDSLSSTVRNLAADDRLSTDAVKKIFQVVYVMEMTATTEKENKWMKIGGLSGNEKSVAEEIRTIASMKESRAARQKSIDDLKNRISLLA